MEKKSSRLVQPASKGLAIDSKKSTDVVGGKLWPRGGRRKEPAGGSLSATKSEPSRKSTPQRAKTFDKRPRPRGTPNPNAVARAETTRLEEQTAAEFGSVVTSGSKKQSLNHLLNFVYTPYAGEGRYVSGRGSNNKSGNRLMVTRKHKYKKEHFLQANCQFIVNEFGDYKVYMNNPDALVDWSLIEQVNIQVFEFPTCPICLYPPVAAKMTRCGHIYCWPCMLHYLSLSDQTSRNCPICYVSIHKEDLKSVVCIPHSTFNVNDTITFKLMKRHKGSLTAYPATAAMRDDDVIFNLSDKEAKDVYLKLLLANQSEIMSIIERESAELTAHMLEDEGCPESCFVVEALALLEDRRNKILNSQATKSDAAFVDNTNAQSTSVKSENGKRENLENASENKDQSNDNNISLIDASNIEYPESEDRSNSGESHQDSPDNNLDSESSYISSENSNQQFRKFYYFYQASDGQHIYLHAINARMLEHTYGSLEFGPKILSGKILEKESGSMTEELRKRLRCLQHLPITCSFEVAEIQLKPPVVTKEILHTFSDQLETRRKMRTRRAKEEAKREKSIAEEENRLLGKYPTPQILIESQCHFPDFEQRPYTESECTQTSEGSTDMLSTTPEFAGPTFAEMLASAKRGTPKLSAPKPSSLNSSSSVKLINVTGSKIKCNNLFNIRCRHDSEGDVEDFEPLRTGNRSLGDAIVQALERAEGQDVSTENGSPASGKKKKKKKNKQKVLFANTMAYSGN